MFLNRVIVIKLIMANRVVEHRLSFSECDVMLVHILKGFISSPFKLHLHLPLYQRL